MNILAVGAGGFLGAILRYGIGQCSKLLAPSCAFPIGTFTANLIGAFIIGIAFDFFTKQSEMGSPLQLFVMVGILGGFTTFSSFSLETITFIEVGKFGLAALYALASVFLSLLGVWLGKSMI